MAESRNRRTGPKRRRWRRAAFALAAAPVVLFGLANLWLATPLGRGWIAKQLGRRVGLHVEIGPGSWSPWAGLVLRDVELRLPADAGLPGGAVDVLKVERIAVRLRWGGVLHGRVAPERIEVVRPDVNIPVELLMSLAGRKDRAAVPPPAAELPALAGEAGEGERGKPSAEGPAGGGQAPAEAGKAGAPSPGAPQLRKRAEEEPTAWLVVRGGRLRIGMGGARDTGLVLDGIDAEIPVRGRAAGGGLKIAKCLLNGEPLGGFDIPLSWKDPQLALGRWQPEIAGMRVGVGLQVILRGDIPFSVSCAVPEQSADLDSGAPGAPRIKAARVAGVARMAGYLRAPSSWLGDARADAVEIRGVNVSGKPVEFDRCSLRAVLRGAVVRVNDARAVGEQFSVLGNGLVFADGRVEALARVVLPEDAAREAGAGVARAVGVENFGFQPLGTPDRWYLDCRIGGSVVAPLFLVPGAAPVPLRSVLRRPVVQGGN